MSRDWAGTGEDMVNGGVDFITGIGRAFGGLGKRFKRAKLEPFVNALCAVVGDVAAKNGNLFPEEIDGFRKFMIRNCHDNGLLDMFSLDELTALVKKYAVHSFLLEELEIVQAVSAIDDPVLAELIIHSAQAVASADGNLDSKELKCIETHASTLKVQMYKIPALPVQEKVGISQDDQCLMCKGTGVGPSGPCVFCKGTGKRK